MEGRWWVDHLGKEWQNGWQGRDRVGAEGRVLDKEETRTQDRDQD